MEEKILLVEDEEKLARMVELELRYEGYQVHKSFDGRSGLERALSGEYDLALLDSVWGFDFVGETNSVDVYIRFLRSKIDEAFDIKLIHTVRGVGYVIREE